MKKKWLILFLLAVVVVATLFNFFIKSKYTFTLAASDGTAIKSEQIQPLFRNVRVSGDCDTEVVFTDIVTKETYTTGSITSGASKNIKLQNGSWYTVEGAGNIKVGPVNVRIE